MTNEYFPALSVVVANTVPLGLIKTTTTLETAALSASLTFPVIFTVVGSIVPGRDSLDDGVRGVSGNGDGVGADDGSVEDDGTSAVGDGEGSGEGVASAGGATGLSASAGWETGFSPSAVTGTGFSLFGAGAIFAATNCPPTPSLRPSNEPYVF